MDRALGLHGCRAVLYIYKLKFICFNEFKKQLETNDK